MHRRYLRELVVRYEPKARWRLPNEGYKRSQDIYRAFKHLTSYPREHLIAVFLDNQSRPLGFETLSIGSAKGTVAEAASVFQAALLTNATGVILVHNHPSQIAEPSREDRRVTALIHAAGELIGVKLLDHVIVAGGGYYSFTDAGDLKTE